MLIWGWFNFLRGINFSLFILFKVLGIGLIFIIYIIWVRDLL